MNRRRFLSATVVTASGLAGCTSRDEDSGAESDSDDTPESSTERFEDVPAEIGLETLASGLAGPVDVVFTDGYRYIAEQRGTIQVHNDAGVRATPLLEFGDGIVVGGEKGLLGIALHPDDESRLFVRYSAPARPETPSGYSHTFVLSEFELADDGLSVLPDSERTILEIPQPQGNHNAGDIEFGPEGYLYVAVGDGGAGGDRGNGHVSDWYDAVDGGNGQDVSKNLLGSILRIDVDAEPTRLPQRGTAGNDAEDGGYAIPSENPLVGADGMDEHYAWGLRNPWRMAFDGEDLYVGDVGQSRFEEVDHIQAGGNYGWNVMEGNHCYNADKCPDSTPNSVRGGESLLEPVIEYPHLGAAVSGISVIGGNVWRGASPSGLDGLYVFGDFRADGALFLADPTRDAPWPSTVLPVQKRDATELSRLRWVGRHDGEMYVAGMGTGSGGVHRLVPADA